MSEMTPAQRRLIAEIRAHGGDQDGAEFWPVVNDWVRDAGPAESLALRNINRSIHALEKGGYLTIDDDGLILLTEQGRA